MATEASHKGPDLNGRVILVTGGTGSFGQAFCRAVIARWTPRKLIVFSRDEDKQWSMSQQPMFRDHDALRYFIGDVRDESRLEMAMREVDYVIHAAALKHVPAAEYNPFECIRTNVHGAENVVQAAIRTSVKRVIALSTDKAVNPVNLYGASKLASDKIFIAANNLAGADGTRFAVVRYGNVVGSRGSVVPHFKNLIASGAKKLPITDERMTRFWITLGQGVDFVLSALHEMEGGEIFVPKIPSMRIVDLAQVMAPDLEHQFIGIRPGEKIHEVLISEDDARSTVELADRYIILPAFTWWRDRGLAAEKNPRVADGFRYVSNGNGKWLDGPQLRKMLKELELG